MAGLADHSIGLKEPGWWGAHGVDLRCGAEVTAVEGHTLAMANGDTVAWSSLVLATGGRPRSLSVRGSDLDGVVSVNDVDGALACAAALHSTASPVEDVVIVGAGFIAARRRARSAGPGAR